VCGVLVALQCLWEPLVTIEWWSLEGATVTGDDDWRHRSTRGRQPVINCTNTVLRVYRRQGDNHWHWLSPPVRCCWSHILCVITERTSLDIRAVQTDKLDRLTRPGSAWKIATRTTILYVWRSAVVVNYKFTVWTLPRTLGVITLLLAKVLRKSQCTKVSQITLTSHGWWIYKTAGKVRKFREFKYHTAIGLAVGTVKLSRCTNTIASRLTQFREVTVARSTFAREAEWHVYLTFILLLILPKLYMLSETRLAKTKTNQTQRPCTYKLSLKQGCQFIYRDWTSNL